MKLMGNMMKEKDDKIIQIIEAVEVFISGVIDLMTLFKGDYDNGDFCSGLVFGKDGSNMLIQLATQFVKHSTKESNRIDTKLLPKPNQRAGESVEDRREAFRNNATQALLDKQKAVNEKVA